MTGRSPDRKISVDAAARLFAAATLAAVLLLMTPLAAADELSDITEQIGHKIINYNNDAPEDRAGDVQRLRQLRSQLQALAEKNPSILQSEDFAAAMSAVDDVLKNSKPATPDAHESPTAAPSREVKLPPAGSLEANADGQKTAVRAPPDTIAWTLDGMPYRTPDQIDALNEWNSSYRDFAVFGTTWLRSEIALIKRNGSNATKWRSYYDSRLATALALHLHPNSAVLSAKERSDYALDNMVSEFARAETDASIDQQPSLDFDSSADFKANLPPYQKWVRGLPNDFLRTLKHAPPNSGVSGSVITPQDFGQYRRETLAEKIIPQFAVQNDIAAQDSIGRPPKIRFRRSLPAGAKGV